MGRTLYKCPYCEKHYVASDKSKQHSAKCSLYEHMEKEHNAELGELSPAQVYFNSKYNKTHGNCVICGKNTTWNESTERYNRFCSNKCKQQYVKDFKAKMKAKYGTEHLLNSPEQQKKMLANRKISGKYKFTDNGEVEYVGSYEKDFLEFLDIVMKFESKDVISPAPQVFKYTFDGKEHFYIPDFYIPSLTLLIEIKDGGTNPNMHHKILEVDKPKELAKDKMMALQHNYKYIKVVDKDYSIFLNYLMEIKSNS